MSSRKLVKEEIETFHLNVNGCVNSLNECGLLKVQENALRKTFQHIDQ